MGFFSGLVSLRSANGEEFCKIERPGQTPIWALSWSPIIQPDGTFILAITDWNQKLTFHSQSGAQIGKGRSLGFDPCTVCHYQKGEYLLIGGSDKTLSMYNTEGVKVGVVTKTNGWIWSAACHSQGTHVAISSQDGTLSVFQITCESVSGIYNDRYAFRHNMTDIIIQHLPTGQKSKIKCRDLVKKISVYTDKLAVQLPERIVIYELFHDESGNMHYQIKEKIAHNFDCSMFAVTAQHLIICSDTKIQLYNFIGEKEREWSCDARIRTIKVVGGPRGREGVLVGLKNGSVLKLFIDSPFYIPLLKLDASINSLDMNITKRKVAVVDDEKKLSVYDLKTKQLEYQENNAENFVWNAEMPDMLCFNSKSETCIKVADFPPVRQEREGSVIGFRGSRIYSQKDNETTEAEISLTQFMDRLIEQGDFDKAYKIASLGIPESNWKIFGLDALEHLNLNIASKCFARGKEFRYLEGIRQIEAPKKDADLFLAEVHILSGNYQEVLLK